jgi:predicted transcriptional regulator
MEPISPSQWVVMRLALRVKEPFETWDLVEALQGDSTLPKLHYKTIASHVERLVEHGYLVREVTGRGGLTGERHAYRFAVDHSEIAARYIDRLLDQLGDDPELLELAEERLRRRARAPGSRSDSGGA